MAFKDKRNPWYDKEITERDPGPAVWPVEAVPAWLNIYARAYLQSRGINQTESEFYDLHFCESGYWANRVLIPVYSISGQLMCFQGRSITDNGRQKYITSGRRNVYMPFDLRCARDVCDTLIVMEGPLDVIAAGRAQVLACAMLGIHPTEYQINQLIGMAKDFSLTSLLVWFDTGAVDSAMELQLKLNPFIPTGIVIQPDGFKDPGSTPAAIIKQTLKEYVSGS